jgi:hypothetical protein
MEGRFYLPRGGVKRRSGPGEGQRGLRSPARKPNSMVPEGLPLGWMEWIGAWRAAFSSGVACTGTACSRRQPLVPSAAEAGAAASSLGAMSERVEPWSKREHQGRLHRSDRRSGPRDPSAFWQIPQDHRRRFKSAHVSGPVASGKFLKFGAFWERGFLAWAGVIPAV